MTKNKQDLINLMNTLNFQIADIAYIHGYELVGKKRLDGSVFYWNMEIEGSGFTRIFKGAIKRACGLDSLADENHRNVTFESEDCPICHTPYILMDECRTEDPSPSVTKTYECQNGHTWITTSTIEQNVKFWSDKN